MQIPNIFQVLFVIVLFISCSNFGFPPSLACKLGVTFLQHFVLFFTSAHDTQTIFSISSEALILADLQPYTCLARTSRYEHNTGKIASIPPNCLCCVTTGYCTRGGGVEAVVSVGSPAPPPMVSPHIPCQRDPRPWVPGADFLPLTEALWRKDLLTSDVGKFETVGQLHVFFAALHEFIAEHGAPPEPYHAAQVPQRKKGVGWVSKPFNEIPIYAIPSSHFQYSQGSGNRGSPCLRGGGVHAFPSSFPRMQIAQPTIIIFASFPDVARYSNFFPSNEPSAWPTPKHLFFLDLPLLLGTTAQATATVLFSGRLILFFAQRSHMMLSETFAVI